MFRIDTGGTGRYCDGISRRHFVQLGVAGMASVGLARVARAVQAGDPDARPRKDTSVILLWLDGGPGHMDLYDMKPDAPVEYRGIWKPIKTNVPGIEISELFPRQAKLADKFSIVRSLHHNDGDHFGGAHRMLTGRPGANGNNQSPKYPGIGAIAAKVCGPRKDGMPAHLGVSHAARKAFDIGSEDPKVRELYGRTDWGQSTLLARRLVEAGATFVTVHMGGWDHHWNLQSGMESYLPKLDLAISGLFTDLSQRR